MRADGVLHPVILNRTVFQELLSAEFPDLAVADGYDDP